MSGFEIKGWCPGALRPMESGDGLVLRIRARNGRLTPDEARLIAGLSSRHGNGLIDLTSRANLQLRGLTPLGHAATIAALQPFGLTDRDAGTEARRNVILSPFAPVGGPAWQVAEAIARAMTAPDAPKVPAKFGFAVDAGTAVLTDVPADIRLRPHGTGWLILPDGADWALEAANPAEAARRAVALAHWFVQTGGVTEGRGRMRNHLRRGAPKPGGSVAGTTRPGASATPGPGPATNGWIVGFAFGQITPGQLEAAAALGPLRLTPWRALLIEGATLPRIPGAILDPCDPLTRVHACTGAPGCPQAQADVRALARHLASRLAPDQTLHVTGCAKACAHQGPASATLIATGRDRFDLIRDGSAHDPVTRAGLAVHDLPAALAKACPQ
ncbi:precorrin-3B synthase [Paracoccus kondratievae]|uniref:Precorrin-3B synthase n=1 Tax=Paracoccus kondratievae TaxID=135740 RepID=A0AAD3NV93_9RHOB|nr:precorrin-3B synthase [Paracoccus kondratievae]GLK62770.1 precorrin-3B synthase [Paracoccus kondratievae]